MTKYAIYFISVIFILGCYKKITIIDTTNIYPVIVKDSGLKLLYDTGKWESYRRSYYCNPYVVVNHDTIKLKPLDYKIVTSIDSIDTMMIKVRVKFIDHDNNTVRFEKSRVICEFAIDSNYDDVIYYLQGDGLRVYKSFQYLKTIEHMREIDSIIYNQNKKVVDSVFIDYIISNNKFIDKWLYTYAKNYPR